MALPGPGTGFGDQLSLDAAAKFVRTTAIQQEYAGFAKKELAFCIASVLNILALHASELPPQVRAAVIGECRRMLAWSVPLKPGQSRSSEAGRADES